MKKKLLALAMMFCLVCTMVPLSTDVASAYGGEPGDVKPTVTLLYQRGEHYTLEYDTYTGWKLDIYAGSDSIINEVIMKEGENEGYLYNDCVDEYLSLTGIPDGAAITVSFAGKYPVASSPRLDSKLIKLSYNKTTYNGKAKKPTFTIDGKKQATLVKKGLITVKYVNNTKPGIAKVIIKTGPKAKGKFEGETTIYFQIAPKKTKISSVTTDKSGDLILDWVKQKNVSGYHVLISESESFEPAKTYRYTVNENKDFSMAFKEAKSGTKYFVKIRAYRDSKYGRAYGAWSKAVASN